ncbi:F0F1 ATP synthase subunit gamma [Bacteroides sp. 51]|uniref:F0F1 ATP synthase subunit gamma n=1 Tax=Bacteroides sp. 51 TaxID=2302938 RepID=UPI0013D2D00C|nr:F0F1 ATP synthase subunit gamma [Bacteroides sp. 51]NDV82706.1 F0F1 ATP synthase subunit gamma [Bacteroides sp. 51]
MASLKEVKGRISSVKSTRKITSAMKMVASAKLHRAQNAIENMLPYQSKLNRILTDFLSSMDVSLDSPFTVQREVKRVGIIVFSSNSSLCGAFNANVIKRFVEVTDRYKTLDKENIKVYPVGKKIEEAVKRLGFTPEGTFQDIADKPSYDEAAKLAENVMDLFIAGELDRVEVIFHHFKSAGAQELMDATFLPIDLTHVEEEAEEEEINAEKKTSKRKIRIDYIVEPSVEEFIASLLPTVLKLKVFTASLDSAASEHAARMMAMQVATDNANELIDDLTKQFNKTRQQTITNELLDIISGSMK